MLEIYQPQFLELFLISSQNLAINSIKNLSICIKYLKQKGTLIKFILISRMNMTDLILSLVGSIVKLHFRHINH